MKADWVSFWRKNYGQAACGSPRQTASVSVRNKQDAFRGEYEYRGKLKRCTLRPFNGGTTYHPQNVQTFNVHCSRT